MAHSAPLGGQPEKDSLLAKVIDKLSPHTPAVDTPIATNI